jgi:hypothetical protein
MQDFGTVGFVGVGVMGGAMCANLARKSDVRVMAWDISPEALQRARENGVEPAGSLEDLVVRCDLVLLSLPGTPEVEDVCLGEGGIATQSRDNQVVADLSTTSVATARRVGSGLAQAGVRFADAPCTRTAKAAVDGTLSFFVGGDSDLFDALVPVLQHMGTDFSHCGDVGSGQVVKLVNNMVCTQTVVALAEALTMGRRAGVDPELLFNTLTTGSANSFALQNHGMRSLLPGRFPTNTYSTLYAIKDVGYAVELAEDEGVDAKGAKLALDLLKETRDAGYADNYYPALLKVVDGGE